MTLTSTQLLIGMSCRDLTSVLKVLGAYECQSYHFHLPISGRFKSLSMRLPVCFASYCKTVLSSEIHLRCILPKTY
jgi:hypothetical protein